MHNSTPSPLTRADVVSIQQNLDCVPYDSTSSSRGLFSVFSAQPLPTRSRTEETWSSSSSSTCFGAERDKGNTDKYITSHHLPDETGSRSMNSDKYQQALMNSNDSPMYSSENTVIELEGACQNKSQSPIFSAFDEKDTFYSADSPIFSTEQVFSVPDASNFANAINDIEYDDESTMTVTETSNDQNISNWNTQELYFAQHQELLGKLHLDFLPAPMDQKELIHHWVTFLDCAMSPVPRIDEPGNDTFMSIALAGVTSTFQESSGEIAVFHGICAASAFSMSQLRQNGDRFYQLAIKHRQLALCHLRHCMQSTDSFNSEPIWAAIMTFFIQEGVRGQPHEWRVHLRGLDSLILSNPQLIYKSMIARTVYESYLCIKILGNIQTDFDLGGLLPELKTVGRIHGLSGSILGIIQQTNILSSAKELYSSTAVDKLELFLWLQSPSSIDTVGLDHCSAKLLVQYAHVYHCAALIHLQRVLRMAVPDSLQDLVETAINHLEAIEMVGNGPKGCIWVWPCIVISAECTTPKLQARMLKWFEGKTRHGFVNLKVACDLSTEVWRRRTEHKETARDIHWQDLIQKTEYDVLPI